MQRSRTQVLYSYLPGSVFIHESGMVVRAHEIKGRQLGGALNEPMLLREIDAYLRAWPDEHRLALPLPATVDPSEFRIITPEILYWEIWPLVFECSRETCKRIHKFWGIRDVSGDAGRCRHCNSRLRQLRYYSAHDCGTVKELHIPPCSQHGYEHIYFEDTGSFRTSVFRCRECGGAVIRRTAQSPCSCGEFHDSTGRSMMRAYTVRDTRTYHGHRVDLINLQSSLFNQLQNHPARGEIAIASYLGLISNVGEALDEADRQRGGKVRISIADWVSEEERYRAMGLSDEEIADLRKIRGPVESGLAAIADVEPAVIKLGQARPLVERAMVFERSEVARITLSDAKDAASERGQQATGVAIEEASRQAERMGIEEVSITWNFPIASGAFGFTRGVSRQGEGKIRGFAQRDLYDSKTPIFAVATETEAVLVTVSAQRVLNWLAERGTYSATLPYNAVGARREILRLFAERDANPLPANEITTLVHSISHCLLRAFEDGQVGFAETSLAEWFVPETLTFALYASSLKSFTLGALWTLINNRTLQWLEIARQSAWRCENDPLCHQRRPRACERCLYLTFGCRSRNDNLSRAYLTEFWSNV
jgi:uncharacterized CHY-type Zn-finger protein